MYIVLKNTKSYRIPSLSVYRKKQYVLHCAFILSIKCISFHDSTRHGQKLMEQQKLIQVSQARLQADKLMQTWAHLKHHWFSWICSPVRFWHAWQPVLVQVKVFGSCSLSYARIFVLYYKRFGFFQSLSPHPQSINSFYHGVMGKKDGGRKRS